jgi:hypothetical protein
MAELFLYGSATKTMIFTNFENDSMKKHISSNILAGAIGSAFGCYSIPLYLR